MVRCDTLFPDTESGHVRPDARAQYQCGRTPRKNRTAADDRCCPDQTSRTPATHQGAVAKVPTPAHPVIDKLPRLDFDINPKLPAGPLVLPSPAMETVAVGVPAMDGIFSIGDLDAPLTPLVRMPPMYPIQAKRRGIEGWVKVNFMVNQQGLVEKIKIVDAHPAGVFDQSAIQSISTWRFNPGTVEGVAVSTWATQILKFELAK